jgi:cytoskeletal protein CcmA (bactofilin family)
MGLGTVSSASRAELGNVLCCGPDTDMPWAALLRLVNRAGVHLRKVPIKKPDTSDTVKPEARTLPEKQSRLGPSLRIKGEICGSEDLLIDGSVEGNVQLEKQKLTLGPTSNVTADIIAGDVIVGGSLKGNVRAKNRIEIKKDGSVTGDLTTPQISIEDGACFKGSIEIEKGREKETDQNSFSPTNSVQKTAAHV